MIFSTNDGRELNPVFIYVIDTYHRLMTGSPGELVNLAIIDWQKYPMDWGHNLPVLTFPPSEYEIRNALPQYTIWVLIQSNSMNHEFDCSHLVVKWFTNEIENLTLNKLISTALIEINWEKYAKDVMIW